MFTLRRGQAQDFEQAMAVFRAAHEARGVGRPIGEDTLARVRTTFDEPTAFAFVAEEATEVVGFDLAMQALADDGAGPPIPGVCHISMIFVAPERWGEGIGRALVESVIVEAREKSYSATQLWTGVDNERALNLYEHVGFTRSGREKDERGERIAHLQRPL